MRFVVLDVDITGTSLRHDRVTGIAALPVTTAVFCLSDLRYCALPPGPGVPTQPGPDPHTDYQTFRRIVNGSAIVTYNAEFVAEMCARTCRACELPPIEGDWIDIAVMAGLVDADASELVSIDYWLDKMRSGGRQPHDASYDVFAMAQMLQAILAYCDEAGIETTEALGRNRDAYAWLRGN